ncbi:hypothetical protein OG596_04090 [Streptomyces sp. NBC_01102]|uniref:hypothetical protein n=1 Tax=unclassified Streptomyces TaxID=2593676 RepID=UPI00386EDC86|nr:hypothetical protein OG596_04090 [Streptomyces sp. NBC_01102]
MGGAGAAVGLFAIGEALWVAAHLRRSTGKPIPVGRPWLGREDVRRTWKSWLRPSLPQGGERRRITDEGDSGSSVQDVATGVTLVAPTLLPEIVSARLAVRRALSLTRLPVARQPSVVPR